MDEAVKRLRIIAWVLGAVVAVIVFAMASSNDDAQASSGAAGVAIIWGFVAWGLLNLIAWAIQGATKKSAG